MQYKSINFLGHVVEEVRLWAYAYNLCTWETACGGSEVQKFKVILGYVAYLVSV